MIDLHTHSTASDGTDTPPQLVANAVRAGIRTLAITDHDTTGGWASAAAAAADVDPGFTLIRGAEFSCVHQPPNGRRISLHLLGYLFDPDDPGLKAARAQLRASRLGRGEAIVEAMAADGYPINWPQVVEIADGGAVGRPHIGQALQQAGVVSSVNEAFADLLANNSRYYVPKQDLPVAQAISLIRQAGGVPVIAHPWARRRGAVLDEQALAWLVEIGLLGIELDHTDHSEDDRQRLAGLAAELGVLTTGSSDYHGTHKTVRLAARCTAPAELERIVSLATGCAPIRSGGPHPAVRTD